MTVRAGDVSTDGRWCFMIFKVTLGQAMPPHWSLLRRRLEAICPSTHGDHSMWRYTSRTRDTQHPFLLQVTSYDRRGFLHGARPPPKHQLFCVRPCGVHSAQLLCPACVQQNESGSSLSWCTGCLCGQHREFTMFMHILFSGPLCLL